MINDNNNNHLVLNVLVNSAWWCPARHDDLFRLLLKLSKIEERIFTSEIFPYFIYCNERSAESICFEASPVSPDN